MQIKAQGILNAVRFVRERHGEEVLEEILTRCSPSVQERCRSAIAIEWHEAAEYEALLEAAAAVLGPSAPKELGAAGARANMSGFMRRAAFYLVRPSYAMKRVASAWSQFNDEGHMRLVDFSENGAVVEVTEVVPPGPLFCDALSGWCEVLGTRVGAREPVARHTACRLRGDATCTWDIEFASLPEAS
ncbi:MAG: hypothetical protein AAGH15_20620 [Myxococcota bacterium]